LLANSITAAHNTRGHLPNPVLIVLSFTSSCQQTSRRRLRAVVLFVVFLILLEPSIVIIAGASVSPRPALQPQAQQSSSPTDKIKEIALQLIQARTEAERLDLLEREKEFVTENLTQALLAQGRVSFEKGSPELALQIGHLAQGIAQRIGDKLGQAQALTTTGNIYRMQGEYDQALEDLSKALPLHESLRNKRGIFYTLFFITVTRAFTGDYDLELPKRLLALGEESENKEWIAMALSQFASVHFAQGDYASGLEYHQKSLVIYESINNKPGIAFALHGIGNTYRMVGDFDKALANFQKSLKLSDEIGSTDLSIFTLNNLGALYRAQGDYSRAEEHLLRTIKMTETSSLGHFSGNKFWLALALSNLGEISRSRGNYSQALAYLERSISVAEAANSKEALAYALGRTGAVLLAQKEYTRAREVAIRGVNVARQSGGRDALWRALLVTGQAQVGLGQITQARQAFEEAISIVEAVRTGVGNNETRSYYSATTREPYEHYIDLLMQLHKQQPSAKLDALALQANERAHARSLLEALTEARADIRHGVDGTLLEAERALQIQLNAAAQRESRLANREHTEEQFALARQAVNEFTTRLQDVQTQIRLNSPRYGALMQPQPLTLTQIQQLLDPETLLLQYALGDERSYLWVVTPTTLESFELPARAAIEKEVRRVVSLISDGRRWATVSDATIEYTEAARRLSEMLLFPAQSLLGDKRLIIVSEGALQYLPFGALPTPPSVKFGVGSQESLRIKGPLRYQLSHSQPLIVNHEIVILPSASTLSILRGEMKTLGALRPAKTVAVLADPVFEENDERVRRSAVRNIKNGNTQSLRGMNNQTRVELDSSRALLTRALEFGLPDSSIQQKLHIARLPFSRFEADAILANALPNESFKATDFRANRETATSGDLANYRFIHFATHGILNTEHPELSGIVLSLVDESGQPVDGFLRLHEIYNLSLPADLVVLSACQTGLGKEIRGEGLVGLTRGFMYAGAPRVVASLWKVDDAATAELMKRFYRGMLRDKMRPAAALRAAQIEMWKQKRWNAPFYWAAFELQGEWK
jgi:CHAT domain-containing protein